VSGHSALPLASRVVAEESPSLQNVPLYEIGMVLSNLQHDTLFSPRSGEGKVQEEEEEEEEE